jgi:hypothetical protein
LKNKTIILLVILISGLSAMGQTVPQTDPYKQGFIIRWTIGYSWQPGNTQTMYAPLINTQVYNLDGLVPMANSSDADKSYKVVRNSYGHGLNAKFSFGYMFNPYIGFDLGVAYSKSAVITATQLHELYLPDSTGVNSPTGVYLNAQLSTQSQTIILSPSIILAWSKPKLKFYPYMRVGISLPVWGQIEHDMNMQLEGAYGTPTLAASPYFLGTSTIVTWQTPTAFSVGFNGALGVIYRPFGFLNFFAELSGQYLTVKGKYSVITQYMADGVDLTSGVGARSLYRLQFNYVNSLNANSNNALYNPKNYNPDAPKQDISPVFPYSSIGFNVGVQLILNKKLFKDQDGFNLIKPKPKKVKKTEAQPAAQ